MKNNIDIYLLRYGNLQVANLDNILMKIIFIKNINYRRVLDNNTDKSIITMNNSYYENRNSIIY